MEQSLLAEVEDRLSMTDDQWAQWLVYTHGYGKQDENGIDILLIRENLRFSPWKRLEKLQRSIIIDFAVARDPENLEALIKALAPYHPARRSARRAVLTVVG